MKITAIKDALLYVPVEGRSRLQALLKQVFADPHHRPEGQFRWSILKNGTCVNYTDGNSVYDAVHAIVSDNALEAFRVIVEKKKHNGWKYSAKQEWDVHSWASDQLLAQFAVHHKLNSQALQALRQKYSH